jgi:hypothetical protein
MEDHSSGCLNLLALGAAYKPMLLGIGARSRNLLKPYAPSACSNGCSKCFACVVGSNKFALFMA